MTLTREVVPLSLEVAAQEVAEKFADHLNGICPSFHIKSRPDGYFLIFEFGKAASRFYKILEEIDDELDENHIFHNRCAISERGKKPAEVLSIPEALLLQKAIAESLTIDRHSFGSDFFARYTSSVSNFEQSIVSAGNHIVYGRRGAGKSSLLAYAMHKLAQTDNPFTWISMQTYESRNDQQVICNVISEALSEIKDLSKSPGEIFSLIGQLDELSFSESPDITAKLNRLIPRVRRQIQSIATPKKPFTIFLDDFHVIAKELQPLLLSALYSIARGNNTYIKLSGIEQFTKTWDEVSRKGLQPPHDATVLKLDLNLTMPDRSKQHIMSILNAHANYCGLPSISYLAPDEVFSRLVLVAAGVPRDSLGLFAQAISKAHAKGQKSVTLLSINAAASEMAEEKLKNIERDTTEDLQEVTDLLEEIKAFCINKEHKNSFLVRIKNNDTTYQLIQKLIALRLVHVLHEGITPHEAGQRYMALMLDYGFYVGIRTARNINFFPTEPRPLLAKDLRKLPIFKAS